MSASKPNVASSTAPPAGFQARLDGANLWDLVQIECAGRARRVIQVTTSNDVGYLFIADGRIVHALTRDLRGRAAAVAILCWETGSVQHSRQPWPAEATIHCSHEVLLLEAARGRDEAGRRRDATPSHVRGPDRESASAADQDAVDDVREDARTPPPVAVAESAAHEAAHGLETLPASSAQFPLAVRIDAAGNVIERRGQDTGGLASLAAYVSQVAALIGQQLGFGRFMALKSIEERDQIIIGAQPDGEVLALRGAADAASLALCRRLDL